MSLALQAYIIVNLILASWVVFLLVWIFAAFGNKQPRELEPLGQRLSYTILIWIGAILLFAPLDTRIYPLNVPVIPHDPVLGWLAAALVLLGLALAFWARATLGRNWSGSVQVKEGHELVTKGPYAIVRHPIYTALLIMVIGTILVVANLGAVLALPITAAGFIIKLLAEERTMRRQFPDAYAAYATRVKRLVPFVW
ncbi:MAG TPA: isoprenylcysteine carboxylmethyltransferase family protein [Candidatus Paceibacterota bacterium]|nr:isoprenylcysteine carboxylmethyltransferase family protein [Candidatus Paceibacterota bacterium]